MRIKLINVRGALAHQMQQWYLSLVPQNTSAECNTKVAVDECGKVRSVELAESKLLARRGAYTKYEAGSLL